MVTPPVALPPPGVGILMLPTFSCMHGHRTASDMASSTSNANIVAASPIRSSWPPLQTLPPASPAISQPAAEPLALYPITPERLRSRPSAQSLKPIAERQQRVHPLRAALAAHAHAQETRNGAISVARSSVSRPPRRRIPSRAHDPFQILSWELQARLEQAAAQLVVLEHAVLVHVV